MKRLIAMLAAMLMAVMPMRAIAAELKIDPGVAYIVVEIQSLDDSVMKGAKLPGTITVARYDPVKGDVRGGEMSPETALDPKKEAVRVTVAGKPVVKADKSRLYVVGLQPDTYVIEGSGGTAFSLGSNMFTLAPGQVLDLGVFKPGVDWVEGEGAMSPAKMMLGAMFFRRVSPANSRPIKLDWHARGAADLALPSVLAGRTVDVAVYEPNRKFGNYLGGLVNRIGGRAARPDAAPPAAAAAIQASNAPATGGN